MKRSDNEIYNSDESHDYSDEFYKSTELMLSNKVKEFIDKYMKFMANPNSPESKKFLADFIVFLRDYYKKIKPFPEKAVIFTPKTFELHLQVLTQIVTIAPALLQFKLYLEMKELFDLTCDFLLPYMECKVATIDVEKEKGKKGIILTVKRFDGNLIAALIYYYRSLQFVKIGDMKSAELALNQAQELRHKPNNLEKATQDIFNQLLKDKRKKFRSNYMANTTEWKLAISGIRRHEEKHLQDTVDYIHYYAWANLSLHPIVKNYVLAECYCDLALDYYNKLNNNGQKVGEKLSPATAASMLYLIANNHLSEKKLNSALRCLTKAREYFLRYKNQLSDGRKHGQTLSLSDEHFRTEFRISCERIMEIDKLLIEIRKAAFSQFKNEWQSMQPIASTRIQFEEKELMRVDFTDKALMKLWTRELKQLQLLFSINDSTVTLHNVHQLPAQQIFQSLQRSKKLLQQDRIKIQKRMEHLAELQNKALIPPPETTLETTPPFEMKHDPSKDLYTVVRPIQTKNNETKIAEAKVTPVEIKPNIDWSDETPDYINCANIHPIPDPSVVNSSIPKNIFYGYIDHLVITNIEVNDEMIAEFQKILSRGKIAAEGNSQGIRPVQGELGHDSDYIFKLNGHAKDPRFYGRIVAKKNLPNGKQVVLIAFDQAIPHNKTLKLHSSPSVYQHNLS